jgi:hypothetical protein
VNFESVKVRAPVQFRLQQALWLVRRLPAFPLLVFVCVAVLSVTAGTKSKGSLSFASRTTATRASAERHSDPGYISALAAANRFLQAWQNQDHETGLLMLTDDAKQHSSEDRMEAFFASGTDAAYEIARGKKTKSGHYIFPVTLFPAHSGATTTPDRPQKSEIVVVRAGKDEWAIDRLP